MWCLSGSVPVCSCLRNESRFCRLVLEDVKSDTAPYERLCLGTQPSPLVLCLRINNTTWQLSQIYSGMRPHCGSGHIGTLMPQWILAKDRGLVGWHYLRMNSFIAKSTRELVIWPSFDGKITSEPNKTGSLTVFSKPLDWLMDTDKKSTLNLTRSFRAGGISCRFFEKVVFIYEQEKQKTVSEKTKV